MLRKKSEGSFHASVWKKKEKDAFWPFVSPSGRSDDAAPAEPAGGCPPTHNTSRGAVMLSNCTLPKAREKSSVVIFFCYRSPPPTRFFHIYLLMWKMPKLQQTPLISSAAGWPAATSCIFLLCYLLFLWYLRSACSGCVLLLSSPQ